MEPSARIFVDYKPEMPPPHPGDGWTRFICVSDTHSRVFPIPDGDVLLHSGDLSSWGYPMQVEYTLEWLQKLMHPVKIIIAGNHDLCLDTNLFEEDQILPLKHPALSAIRDRLRGEDVRNARIHYLEHESITVTTSEGRSWLVYGSPATPRYTKGAFQYDSKDLAQRIYQQIPGETEILLTHTPPYHILDKTRRGKNAGCTYLAERMQQLDHCRLHVFGHIHEAWGAIVTRQGVERVSVNAALGSHGSQPIIVDLQNSSN